MLEATINVLDTDAEAVATAIAELVGQPSPTLVGEDWEIPFGDTVRLYINDDNPTDNDGYPVNVDVQSLAGPDGLARAARDIYDILASGTDWGLRLLNDGGAPIAQRPAASRAT